MISAPTVKEGTHQKNVPPLKLHSSCSKGPITTPLNAPLPGGTSTESTSQRRNAPRPHEAPRGHDKYKRWIQDSRHRTQSHHFAILDIWKECPSSPNWLKETIKASKCWGRAWRTTRRDVLAKKEEGSKKKSYASSVTILGIMLIIVQNMWM